MKKSLTHTTFISLLRLSSLIVAMVVLVSSFSFGQQEDDYFITTWEVTAGDLDITIPTQGNGYDYTVDWGDGNTSTNVTGDATHIYATPGTYTVKIDGLFPRIYFINAEDKDKIQTVEQWGTIEWSSMSVAFFGCSNLQITATDAPDLSSVISMFRMFSGATAFNSDIGHWDVSNVTDMSGMFWGADAFDQDIGGWDVGNVFGMSSMFAGATAFNQDIGGWDVSGVTNMSFMFFNAPAFNQDIGGWDVDNVIDMASMFSGATVFNQDIGGWDVSSVTNMESMLYNSGLSTANYDATLIGWQSQAVQNGVSLGADGLTYCAGEDARQALIDDHSWSINGDIIVGADCGSFITTWEVTAGDLDITIPTTGGGYDYTVDWGDGNSDTNVTGDAMHTYTEAGTYTVSIEGDFPRILFNNGGDKDKIQTIEQWGLISWKSMENAFFGCTNLTINATDVPDLSFVSNMRRMFRDATSFNSDISGWDVSGFKDMTSMFQGATSFNSDLSSWDISGFKIMSSMFLNATSFNSDISDWDVSGVINMSSMFFYATSFNSDISGWDVSSVVSMQGMFNGATSFNSDIGNWDVSSVTGIGMASMFAEATSFNSDISNWDVSSVTNMSSMFFNATSFNQDISGWDVSSVTNMGGMLSNSGLSTANYDATLIGWESQAVQNGVSLGATGLTYCAEENARQALIDDHSWTITDAGAESYTYSIADAILDEGNTGTSEMMFTISRTSSGCAATINWSTSDGTATAGSDYVAVMSGTADFASNELTKDISVTINGDEDGESDETFTVTLTLPTGSSSTLADGTATGTITNDDCPVAIDEITNLMGETCTDNMDGSFTISASCSTCTNALEYGINNGGLSSTMWQDSPDFSGLSSQSYDIYVREKAGGATTCQAGSFVVVQDVPDTEAPTFICVQSYTVTLGDNDTYTMTTGDIADLYSGFEDNCSDAADISAMLSQSVFDVDDVGTLDITLTLEDKAENSDECIISFTIQEVVPNYQIGDQFFETLQDAINELNGEQGIIFLVVDNYEDSSVSTIPSNVTLVVNQDRSINFTNDIIVDGEIGSTGTIVGNLTVNGKYFGGGSLDGSMTNNGVFMIGGSLPVQTSVNGNGSSSN